ncbi:sister chromatid cohesion protein PDS5 homolog A-A-like isoform X2 [Argiope bruennichi]|uniref:sister chromatid cohesion protein PDS5 homolog A-A-like isoform X2 n=1 Tax=Argiope bruennichi TaxID=94029 RepID=UPI0024948242|nr:sister chromatid cohesion protein PDS5 homolog A-A-like isoform X2 [Argiope bruennichi]
MASSMEGLVYPSGVRDLTEDTSTDDLVRRLKECAVAFQSMAQDEENARIYEPLAHLLISEKFLEHKSRDVRLLVACIIADMFRISAPDAPYRDEYQIKILLEFFIDQLKGLNNPRNPSFKRYFYLLENLSVVKTFTICFDLEDCQRIMCQLFKFMFKIINDDQYLSLQRIIVDLLCPLINEADVVPAELINIIFNHIIEPMKSQNTNACKLAQELLRKTAPSIGIYVQAYFTNEFYLGEPNVSERLCDLIFELHSIDSSMMGFVIPQLEGKLKTSDEQERMMVTRLVARMFSEQVSNMINENQSLWASFLSRFTDVSANVRLLCTKFVPNLLWNQPGSRNEIEDMIKQRNRDADEDVRHQIVISVCDAASKDLTCLSADTFQHIKERTLDKKFHVRKEALLGLSRLYKQYLVDPEYIDPDSEEKLGFVKNKVLHVYYQSALEDRFLVERILQTCLVPYQTPMEKRMKVLYRLFATLDDYSTKAFKEILKNQRHMRSLTNGLLEIIQQKRQEKTKLLEAKINAIARNLLDSRKSAESIVKFCKDLENNLNLRSMMSLLLNGNISCAEAERKVKEILRFLGEPALSNVYYTSIKQLLERIVPVLLDKTSLKYLVFIARDSILGDGVIEAELNLENSGQKALELINALANTYPHYFMDEQLFSTLVEFLQTNDPITAEVTLETLSHISKGLENIYPTVYSKMLPILKHFMEFGTHKQAKYAVYALHKMVNDKEKIFWPIIQTLKNHFSEKSQHFRTALVSVGHIARLCHDMFASEFKQFVARIVMRKLLMGMYDYPPGENTLWCPFEDLPYEAKLKIEGMKFMVNWLIGLKDMEAAARSTFKLLNAVISTKGNLIENTTLGLSEASWMRLAAAKCVLKLCREPTYIDCLPPILFINIAYIMCDNCPEVREHFVTKLNKGLYILRFPLEFLAILALGGLDPRREFRVRVKQYLVQNITRRKEYIKGISISCNDLPRQWPDYALPMVVYLLAHAPFFETYNDLTSLYKIKDCLQLFLEALIWKNDNYSFPFFKRLLENIKQTKDALYKTDEDRNLKLYAVCDLALNILMSRPNITLKEFPGQPKLNSKFFTDPDKNYSNLVTYLPKELLNANNLLKSGFEIQAFRETKGKNVSKNRSESSTSQKEPMPSTSKEVIPSTSSVEPIPSTSKAIHFISKTKVFTASSTRTNPSTSQLKNRTNVVKYSSDSSLHSGQSREIKLSATSNHSETNSIISSVCDASSESKNEAETSNSFDSITNNGSFSHSDSMSDHSDLEFNKNITSVGRIKINGKSKNMSISKKRHLSEQSVAGRKSTKSASNVKNGSSSFLSSKHRKQNDLLLSSPSSTNVDASSSINKCYVYLERLEYSHPEIFNRIRNGTVSFKRKRSCLDIEDYSSNQGSSADSYPSEEKPRKRGRPPKKDGKSNRDFSSLLPNKKRKTASVSTNSFHSSGSGNSTAGNSSAMLRRTKSVIKNGILQKEKKPSAQSRLNAYHSSKKIDSMAKVREELTAEINEICNVQKTSKTVTNKLANGQQNKKNDERNAGRQS